MSLTSLFRQPFFKETNGRLLKLGALINSETICSLMIGETYTYNNSAALRIAAKHKNYRAFNALLTESTADISPPIPGNPFDFASGNDLSAVRKLAETDNRLATSLTEYDSKVTQNADIFFKRHFG